MATRLEEIPIEQIRNNDNIREDMGNMQQLAHEVKSMGVVVPIMVYPHPDLEGDYRIQEGHRRRLAASMAGLSTIPCIVIDVPKRGRVADLEVMMTTGRNHKTLTEAEFNHGVQGLLDVQDVTTIGKKFDMPRKEIKARAKLSKGPVELQKRFESGSLDLLAVQKIQELEEQGAEGLLDTVVAELESTWNATSSNPHALNRTLERAKTINASNVEVARLRSLGAEEAPSDASHSGGFRRNAAEMTDEEHIAEGHRFERNKYDDETTWYMPQDVPKPAKATDAEKAEKQRASRLNGFLGIAFRTRQAFLAEQVRLKDGGAGQDADFEMLYAYVRADIVRLSPEFLAAVTGIGYPEGADEYGPGYKIRAAWLEKVEKRLRTFTWRQLARMAALYGTKDTDKQLRFVKSFERTGADGAGSWRSRARWLEDVQRFFGYELDSAEVEAIESAKDKAGPDRDKDYDVDTVTETCSGCHQAVVGGEGWDGLCGDCADRAEAAADGAED